MSWWRRSKPEAEPFFGLMGGAAAVAARIAGASVDEAMEIGYLASAAFDTILVGEAAEFKTALREIQPR